MAFFNSLWIYCTLAQSLFNLLLFLCVPLNTISQTKHFVFPSALQCGFFNHAKYEDKVPSYSAVRIKREERTINPRNGDWENLEKKPWMTTWHRNEHYS